MTRTGTLTLAVFLWVGANGMMLGCSGSGGGGIPSASGGSGGSGGSGAGGSTGGMMGSGVDGTKKVSALTDAEKGKVCDYFASLVGGYGKSNTCGQGMFMPPATQTDCVQQFAVCDAKESDYETCAKAQADAQKTCTDTAFATAGGTPACMAVLMAGC
jgi:hypothetical protein